MTKRLIVFIVFSVNLFIMGGQNEKPGNCLDPVAGEIYSDLTKTLPGFTLPADVIVEDEIYEMSSDVRADALIGRMNEEEREAVKSTIERALLDMNVKVLEEVVNILRVCVPVGVRKPELCSGDSSRGICCWVEENVPDTEMTINFRVEGMDCKINVEEDGVKMYVSIGPKFVLYCK